jgi:hypothetical protein
MEMCGFLLLLSRCFETSIARKRQTAIKELLARKEWAIIYQDKKTRRKIYSENEVGIKMHEIETAKALCSVNFDVLFTPDHMFAKKEKRFDIILIRDHIILKAELKSIASKNPDTIAKRIIEGSEQSTRLVLDILSNVEKKILVDALQSGIYRNRKVVEVLLFYKSSFYRLPRNLIKSRRIFNIIK